MRRRELLQFAYTLSLTAIVGSVVGCGGGKKNNGGGGSNTGTARVKIVWPLRSRSVVTVNGLASALSAKIKVTSADSGTVLSQFTANRDATRLGSYSEIYSGTEKLKITPMVVEVEFRSDAEGQGELVGIATAADVLPDSTTSTDPPVTIDATRKISKVTILANQKLGVGETREFSFLAQDENKVTVPVTPGSGVWSLLEGIETLNITADGKATGLAYGKAKISVRVDGIASDVQEITVTDPQREIREFILSMREIEIEPETTATLNTSSLERDDQVFTTTRYKATINVTDLAGFNPNIGTIWPGALVQGKSLKSGVLAAVSTSRTPGTLLLSTLGIPSTGDKTQPVSKVVDRPSAATIEEARSRMFREGFVVPAKLSQVFKQFFSLEHAMTQIGASVSYLGNSIKAQMDSESYKTNSNVMVLFTQEYYTVAMEPPTSPISYFDNSVRLEDLTPYANATDNPLCFVQSVTYGRMGMLFASSSVAYDSLKRSIEAAVRWATGSADANYGSEEQKVVRESEVKMLLLGGSPDPGLRLVPTTQQALDTFQAWVNQPITNSPEDIQLGVPISYRVNYLKNNNVAKMSFSTEFDRTASSPIPQLTDWSVTFHTADDDKDNDTALRVEVLANGTLIANHSENGEKFDNGSTKSRGLAKVAKLYARDQNAVRFHVRIDPNGNDTWDFSYTLSARNTGGGSFSKSGHMRLSQSNRDGTQ